MLQVIIELIIMFNYVKQVIIEYLDSQLTTSFTLFRNLYCGANTDPFEKRDVESLRARSYFSLEYCMNAAAVFHSYCTAEPEMLQYLIRNGTLFSKTSVGPCR